MHTNSTLYARQSTVAQPAEMMQVIEQQLHIKQWSMAAGFSQLPALQHLTVCSEMNCLKNSLLSSLLSLHHVNVHAAIQFKSEQ